MSSAGRELPRIFLSYARADDEPFVSRLYLDLEKYGFQVWWDRVSMPSRALTFLQEIKDAIDHQERLLLVLGPSATRSEYVRLEWQYALSCCKVVNPILRIGDYELLPDELKMLDVPDFRQDTNYSGTFTTLLRQLNEPIIGLGRLFGLPSLPPHHVHRTTESRAVKSKLLADLYAPISPQRSAHRLGIQGMGGIGKSVLANAVARDCEVRRAFPDGIIWVTLSQEPNLILRQLQIAETLTNEPLAFEDTQQGTARLSKLLHDKACLLVLDDVWKVEDIDAFDVLGSKCRMLVTTRDISLDAALGVTEYHLGVFDNAESLLLLANWTRQEIDNLPPEAYAIVDECGNLPLALAMIGATIRQKPNRWANMVFKLKNADIDMIQQHFPNYQYRSVKHSFQISFEDLEPTTRDRYTDFAIFFEDIPVPEGVLYLLWGLHGLNEYEAQDVIDLLIDRSLIQKTGDGKLALHDLQYDFVRKQAKDLPRLHNMLFEAYRSKYGDKWFVAADDGYLADHIHLHLAAAKSWSELTSVLTDLKFLEFISKRVGVAHRTGARLERFFSDCLGQIPDDIVSSNQKLSRLRTGALMAALELTFARDCGKLDEQARCSSCTERAIIRGDIDLGFLDSYDNYFAWCTNCFWAWSTEERNADRLLEFDYSTNTYR